MTSLNKRIVDKYNSILSLGTERTAKVKKNIVLLAVYKGLSVLINLLLVPITLNYVNSATYGIWLTLSSIVAWVSFFDIGINNGLKNRLTEVLAVNDYKLGKVYVSTTYAMLSLIFIPLLILLLIVIPYIDWASFLNIQDNKDGLVAAMSIIVTYFCLNFILSTVNVVIYAYQEPADAALRSLIQQIVSLFIIFVLTLSTNGDLVKLCLGLCVSPILVVLLYNITLFKGRYKEISPSLKSIDFKKLPDLLKLGLKFFVIQVAGIIQFQLVNFLIIRYYGAGVVTAYNIAYKYFSVLYMVWGILITPVWAAVTDAKATGDYAWISKTQKKYIKIFVLFTIIGLLMLAISSLVYSIWIGDSVNIGFSLSAWLLLYNLCYMFASIFVNILNGLGELKIQTITSIISPFVFLFVTWLLINKGVGVYAIIIGSIVANFNGYLLAPIQCSKYLMDKTIKNKVIKKI